MATKRATTAEICNERETISLWQLFWAATSASAPDAGASVSTSRAHPSGAGLMAIKHAAGCSVLRDCQLYCTCGARDTPAPSTPDPRDAQIATLEAQLAEQASRIAALETTAVALLDRMSSEYDALRAVLTSLPAKRPTP